MKEAEALNKSAASLHKAMLSLLVASLFVTFTTLGIDDRVLFEGERIKLPLLGLSALLETFFWSSPTILLSLSLYCALIHQLAAYRLTGATRRLESTNWLSTPELQPSMAILRMMDYWVVPTSLRVLATVGHSVVYVLFPLVPFSLLIYRAAAYRSGPILGFQTALFLAAAVLSVWIAVSAYLAGPIGARSRLNRFSVVVTIFLVLVLVGFTYPAMTKAKACNETSSFSLYPVLGFTTHLRLDNATLGYPGDDESESSKASSRSGRGFKSMAGRDLTCADFSGSRLSRIDFQGAVLTKAQFVSSTLEDVHFGPEGLTTWRLKGMTEEDLLAGGEQLPGGRKVSLAEASFADAILKKVIFLDVDLRGVSFENAELQSVRIWKSEGDQIDLRDAGVLDSSFADSSFELLAAQNSAFGRTSFRETELLASQLKGASVFCADFGGSKIRYSFLERTSISDADFSGASIYGSSFSSMELEFGVDLELEQSSLYLAKVDAICQKNESELPPLGEGDLRAHGVPDGLPRRVDVLGSEYAQKGRGWGLRARWEKLDPGSDATAAQRAITSGFGGTCNGIFEKEHIPNADASHVQCLDLESRIVDEGLRQEVIDTMLYGSGFRKGENYNAWTHEEEQTRTRQFYDELARALVKRAGGDPAAGRALKLVKLCPGLLIGDRLRDALCRMKKDPLCASSPEPWPEDLPSDICSFLG